MAGDWIKVEMATPDKPEVISIANELGIDQDAVVGKLLRIWIWADTQSVDGNALSVTSPFLDRLVFCNGFAAAMRKVGWLEGRDMSLSFPQFDRHNGQTAKQRAKTNRRVAKSRKKKRECNESVTLEPLPKALPEKRREESTNIYKTRARDLNEIEDLCGQLGLKKSDAEFLWHKWVANDWTNDGKPIKDWRATVRSWKAAGYLPSQKMNGSATGAPRAEYGTDRMI